MMDCLFETVDQSKNFVNIKKEPQKYIKQQLQEREKRETETEIVEGNLAQANKVKVGNFDGVKWQEWSMNMAPEVRQITIEFTNDKVDVKRKQLKQFTKENKIKRSKKIKVNQLDLSFYRAVVNKLMVSRKNFFFTFSNHQGFQSRKYFPYYSNKANFWEIFQNKESLIYVSRWELKSLYFVIIKTKRLHRHNLSIACVILIKADTPNPVAYPFIYKNNQSQRNFKALKNINDHWGENKSIVCSKPPRSIWGSLTFLEGSEGNNCWQYLTLSSKSIIQLLVQDTLTSIITPIPKLVVIGKLTAKTKQTTRKFSSKQPKQQLLLSFEKTTSNNSQIEIACLLRSITLTQVKRLIYTKKTTFDPTVPGTVSTLKPSINITKIQTLPTSEVQCHSTSSINLAQSNDNAKKSSQEWETTTASRNFTFRLTSLSSFFVWFYLKLLAKVRIESKQFKMIQTLAINRCFIYKVYIAKCLKNIFFYFNNAKQIEFLSKGLIFNMKMKFFTTKLYNIISIIRKNKTTSAQPFCKALQINEILSKYQSKNYINHKFQCERPNLTSKWMHFSSSKASINIKDKEPNLLTFHNYQITADEKPCNQNNMNKPISRNFPSSTIYIFQAIVNCFLYSYYCRVRRSSISFFAGSSMILVLCYLIVTLAASTNAEPSSQLDRHPIKSIDWSKFDETSSDKEILDLLLEKKRYDKRLLPPVNDEDFCCGMSSPDMAKLQNAKRLHKRGTLTVNVNVLLLSLASPDESSLKYEVEFLLNQQWTDPRLQYGNKSHYEFLNALHHHDSIWTPDTYFIMHGDFKDPIIPMHFALRIFRNGTITYAMRRHLILSCQGSLHIFPFDDPKCSFSMESISYEEAQIKYVWKNDEDTLRKSPSLTTLNAYLIKNQTTACDQNSWRGNYSCLQVELTFTRDRAYYFTTVFIPGIILVTSSFITFWLEWNAVPARVMIGVTTMLNFFTTSNGFRSTLPVVSNLTAMNVWDGVCMCFIYASLLEFVCVNYFGRKTPKRDAVYRPGENVVTQEIIEREFHAAVSTERSPTSPSAGKARKASNPWDQQQQSVTDKENIVDFEKTLRIGSSQSREVSSLRSRTISTNTPPLLVRRGSVHVDIHKAAVSNTIDTSNLTDHIRPTRHKSPTASTTSTSSPSKITELIEQAQEKVAETSKDETSQSENTCFVQVRKREPHHPIRVAKTIDVIARITFPTAYAIFLIFFFVHYKGFS